MAVDGQGRPVRFILTGGQRNDITQAPALLAGFKPKCVLADKGYDSRQLVAQIHSLGAQLVIPPRSCQQPRAYDKALYRLRNRIERCFARLKQFRRIATRFDRKPSHFLAFLYLASIPLWVGECRGGLATLWHLPGPECLLKAPLRPATVPLCLRQYGACAL